jgi:glycosyltransferase involved in cell wall biosynthesis
MFQLSNLPKEYQETFNKLREVNRESVSKARIAVVSFYCNRLVWTKCCIKSLIPEYAGVDFNNYKLFLINNNSTDGTDFFLNEFAQYKPFVEQIRHIENKGKPWAFNHVLNQINADDYDYVVSIDGDVRMPENWLLDMITCYRELERTGIKVGQLACDYEFLAGLARTVNPNSVNQPDHCKVLPSGIVLDTYPDVAGGCILWKTEDIKEAGGYQIIPSPTTGKANLYGMDDGLISLYMKRNKKLSCYLVNVRAQHWGDYDALLFPRYVAWKQQNLNPIAQQKIAPQNIGVEFDRWEDVRYYTTFKAVEKEMKEKFPPAVMEAIRNQYHKGLSV